MTALRLLLALALIPASSATAIEHRAATNLFDLAVRAERVIEARVLAANPDGWLYLACEEAIRGARRGELLVLHRPSRLAHGAALELFEPGRHYLLFLVTDPAGNLQPIGGTRGVVAVQPHVSPALRALQAWVATPGPQPVERLLELATHAAGRPAEDAAWALCARAVQLREPHRQRLAGRLLADPGPALARALIEALAAHPSPAAIEHLARYALHSAADPPALPRLVQVLRAHLPDLPARLATLPRAHPTATPALRARWRRIAALSARGSLPGVPGDAR